jgi:hypothetical protein
MDIILEIIKTIVFGVVGLVGLLVLIVIVISLLPVGNPLRQLLGALSMRVGATILAGVVAIPVEPILGVDVLYDVGVPVVLLCYWLSFFPKAASILSGSSSGQAAPSKEVVPHHS